MHKARSLVLEHPAPAPEASRDFMATKLAYHTDAWDVAEDLRRGIDEIAVVDARSRAAYARGHIPGAMRRASGDAGRGDRDDGGSGNGRRLQLRLSRRGDRAD